MVSKRNSNFYLVSRLGERREEERLTRREQGAKGRHDLSADKTDKTMTEVKASFIKP